MTYTAEVRRKLVHLGSTAFPLLYVFLSPGVMIWIVAALAAILLPLDLLRIHAQRMNRLGQRLLGAVLRPRESRTLTGATWMAISGLLCVLFLEKWDAITAALFLTVSDALAALVGRKWGRPNSRGKSLAGSGAFFGSALLIALVLHLEEPLVAIAGAAAATAAEAWRVRIGGYEVDDNLSICVLSGLAMLAMRAATN